MVSLEKIQLESTQDKGPRLLNLPDEVILKEMIKNHLSYTNSPVAKLIIDNWENELNNFVKVMPHEYRRALNELHDAASMEAA